MRLMSFVTLSSALFLSTAAVAETKAPGDSAQPSAEKSDSAEKKICKRLETSGTRMAPRACLTKEEWKKVEEQK